MRKQFQRAPRLAILAVGYGLVGERLGRFVSNLHLLEQQESFFGNFLGFITEIQLNVDIRQVQIAERHEVGVGDFLGGRAGAREHFDGLAIIAAEIVEIGDVVIGDQVDERQIAGLQQHLGALIGFESTREIVHADETHGNVIERNGQFFGVSVA